MSRLGVAWYGYPKPGWGDAKDATMPGEARSDGVRRARFLTTSNTVHDVKMASTLESKSVVTASNERHDTLSKRFLVRANPNAKMA